MKINLVTTALVLGIAAVVGTSGCGDDGTTSTGGGSGGAKTFSIAPGTWAADLSVVDCTTMQVILSQQDVMPVCVEDVVEDFFGYPCTIKRTGNALSISCDLSQEVYTGCTESVHIHGDGTASSTSIQLSGTIQVSDSPLACADSIYCWAFDVSLDKTGPAPSACTYADVNTVAATIDSGPLAGAHTLDTSGSSGGGPGAYTFQFQAFSQQSPVATAPAGGNEQWISMSVQIPPLNPATLPQTLPVTVIAPGVAAGTSAAGVSEVIMQYYEQSADYSFFGTSATGMGMTIHELTADYVAGTFNVAIQGTAYNNGTPSTETRTLTGGFFVTASDPNRAEIMPAGALSQRLSELAARFR